MAEQILDAIVKKEMKVKNTRHTLLSGFLAVAMGAGSASASVFQSALTDHLASGTIVLAQIDEDTPPEAVESMSADNSVSAQSTHTVNADSDVGADAPAPDAATTTADADATPQSRQSEQAAPTTTSNPWAAVGDGAVMQQGLGGGNPADIEARKQAAEQAVKAYLEAEQKKPK